MTRLRLAYQLLVKGFSASLAIGCTVRCTLSRAIANSVIFSDSYEIIKASKNEKSLPSTTLDRDFDEFRSIGLFFSME